MVRSQMNNVKIVSLCKSGVMMVHFRGVGEQI